MSPMMDHSPEPGGNSYTIQDGNQTEQAQSAQVDLATNIRTQNASAVYDLDIESIVDSRPAGPDGSNATITGEKSVSLSEAVSQVGQAAYSKAMEIGAQLGLDTDTKMEIAMLAKQHAEYVAAGRGGQENASLQEREDQGDSPQKANEPELDMEVTYADLEDRLANGFGIDNSPITEQEQNALAIQIGQATINEEIAQQLDNLRSLLGQEQANREVLAGLAQDQINDAVIDLFSSDIVEAYIEAAEQQEEIDQQREERERAAVARLAANNPELASRVAVATADVADIFAELADIANDNRAERDALRTEQELFEEQSIRVS